MLEEYLAVGKIVNTHGIKGEMRVMPLTSDVSRFDYLKLTWVEMNNEMVQYYVEKSRYHKQFVIIKLYGIDSVEKAEELKGCFLNVDRKNARILEEDEYFIADLINCDVYENNTLLGKVTDVLQAGGNDCYVVNGSLYGEILIPVVNSVVHEVDIQNKKISVVLPEGLVDKNDL